MDAARASNAPELSLYQDAAANPPPPARPGPLPPREAQWRARRVPWRRRFRRAGIGGGLLLAVLLLATILIWPLGEALERLGPWLAWPQAEEETAPRADRVSRRAPAPAAGPEQPAPPRAADDPATVAPTPPGDAAGADTPTGFPPLPSFKPATDR